MKRTEEREQEKFEIGWDDAGWYSEEEVEGGNLGEREQEWTEGVDIGQFELRARMKFDNRNIFKEVLQDWSMRRGYEMKFIKNEARVITARCKGGCEWSLRASIVQNTHTFQIKKLKGAHTCAYKVQNNHADYRYLAKRILEAIKDNPSETILSLKNRIKRDLGIECSIFKVYRAKRLALRMLSVDISEQYKMLYDYCEIVGRRNSRSTLVVKVDRNLSRPKFQRMYCCLGAVKEGFLSSCRPIIGLDGCFLKGLHVGQLLSAGQLGVVAEAAVG